MDNGRDVSRDTVMLTYEELAGRLGIDVQSARRRALRQRWSKTRGNDGKARVAVPATVVAVVTATDGATHAIAAGGVPAAVTVTPDALSHLLSQVGEVGELRERLGRAEGERDAAQGEAAALRTEVARLRDEVLAERERANTGLARIAEAARLREAVVAERERANVALERALEAEARLMAGTPGARALKAVRTFLGQWKRP